MGMTQGTPARVPNAARLTLQIATTEIATSAITAIFRSVRLTGGATRPLRRRRLSPNQSRAAIERTTTAIAIQLTVGAIVPHIKLYSTCRFGFKPARLG